MSTEKRGRGRPAGDEPTETIGLRVPASVARRLRELAAEQRRPVGALARLVIEDYCTSSERRKK